jgi:RecB family endonuclease NucS
MRRQTIKLKSNAVKKRERAVQLQIDRSKSKIKDVNQLERGYKKQFKKQKNDKVSPVLMKHRSKHKAEEKAQAEYIAKYGIYERYEPPVAPPGKPGFRTKLDRTLSKLAWCCGGTG